MGAFHQMIILQKRFHGLHYMGMEGGCAVIEVRNFFKRLALFKCSVIDWMQLHDVGKVTHVMYRSTPRAMLVGVRC